MLTSLMAADCVRHAVLLLQALTMFQQDLALLLLCYQRRCRQRAAAAPAPQLVQAAAALQLLIPAYLHPKSRYLVPFVLLSGWPLSRQLLVAPAGSRTH